MSITRKYTTVVELHDKYEFCIPPENRVEHGTVISINYDTKSFDFKCSDGRVYNNITDRYIRGISRADDDTWIEKV